MMNWLIKLLGGFDLEEYRELQESFVSIYDARSDTLDELDELKTKYDRLLRQTEKDRLKGKMLDGVSLNIGNGEYIRYLESKIRDYEAAYEVPFKLGVSVEREHNIEHGSPVVSVIWGIFPQRYAAYMLDYKEPEYFVEAARSALDKDWPDYREEILGEFDKQLRVTLEKYK